MEVHFQEINNCYFQVIYDSEDDEETEEEEKEEEEDVSENGSDEDQSLLVSRKKVLVNHKPYKCVELLKNILNTRVLELDEKIKKKFSCFSL